MRYEKTERRLMTQAQAVQVRGLTKKFGDFVALDHIDLDVAQGEFFSLLGSSGSGKSTLMRIIGGFDSPTEGKVLIHGNDVSHLGPGGRPTNMVFQHLALFPHLDVVENIAFGLRMRRLSQKEIRRKVDDILSLVGLDQFATRQIAQLSGGQKQRVAVARALVNNPSVLLLDEPLSALDLKLRQQMQIELRRIQRELGATFIFVTHDQGEAITMSDRIAVMSQGRIAQIGSPQDVYGAPASRFVANFLGDSNFLEAKIVGAQGSLYMVDCRGYRAVVRSRSALQDGADVMIALRYENVDYSTDPFSEGLAGEVAEVIYLGNLVRTGIRLELTGEMLWVDKMADLGVAPPLVGTTTRVSWKPQAGVALTD